MMDTNNVFSFLNAVNCKDKVEKKNGLSYLSWTYAWAEVKKKFPNASYKIWKDESNKPYVLDEETGYMVYTEVTIEGITHEMWLPVMDGANKAMKNKPYTYKVYNKFKNAYEDKRVEAATMFDINKTIMRCLTKNLAMHGLGLYIYSGEDLPEEQQKECVQETQPDEESQKEQVQEYVQKTHQQVVNAWIDRFNNAATMEDVKNAWNELPKELQKELVSAKDCAKKRVKNGQ